ncbi:MAG: shikimate dehydrogenase [Candidatus Omnitrophota bacterium]|jgi:shikimate dehydrogenase
MAKKIYGLVGHPVKHSLSPAMQNAAFKTMGLDAEYTLFDVPPEKLEGFLGGLASSDISGVNVTIPHKINAKEYIEKNGSLDESARKLGAVNTVKVEDGVLRGLNTDGPGFYRSLVKDLGFEPEGKDICILGAGGAARAIVMYLGSTPKSISIFDIDDKKVEDLKDHYAGYFDVKRVISVAVDGLKGAVERSQLLINTTPVGMHAGDPSPIGREMLHPGLFVYDIVYNRPKTEFVREANSMKLHAVTGLGMFLYQGAIAFETWTGIKAPVDVMKKTLKDEIKRMESEQ